MLISPVARPALALAAAAVLSSATAALAADDVPPGEKQKAETIQSRGEAPFDSIVGDPAVATDVFIFRGDSYYRYNGTKDRITALPKKISADWKGLNGSKCTSRVDAVARVPNIAGDSRSSAYFFCGNEYVPYDFALGAATGKTGKIAEKWPQFKGTDFEGGIDAALEKADGLYLFKGKKYATIRANEGGLGSPEFGDLSAWAGLEALCPKGVDGAAKASLRDYNYGKDDVWLFCGGTYVLYDSSGKGSVRVSGKVEEAWMGVWNMQFFDSRKGNRVLGLTERFRELEKRWVQLTPEQKAHVKESFDAAKVSVDAANTKKDSPENDALEAAALSNLMAAYEEIAKALMS